MQEGIGSLAIRCRDDGFLERLTDVLLGTFAEREDSRSRLLSEVHLTLKGLVDERFVGLGPGT